VSEIVLTIDNLGEASELERGTWSGEHALGAHPSVTVALPRLLDALAERDLVATFCVEAINCRLNPGAVRSIADAGHEIAVHGYRHETWASLPPAQEGELLHRALFAFAALGQEPTGFRPPGGALTAETPALLRELGFAWASPAADAVPDAVPAAAGQAPTWLPFSWQDVDALYLLPAFDGLRRRRGLTEMPLPAAAAGRALEAALGAPGRRTIVLHPFLMLEPGWWEQVQRFMDKLAARVSAGSIRCRTAGTAAGRRHATTHSGR
jgi:peptidoglycan/xylan/chitin deacetylase (PgdA/CDA1 family)